MFCEKPHSLDAPGLRVATAACEDAKKKNLNVVSGLCWRYDPAVRETMKRIRDGAIGEPDGRYPAPLPGVTKFV